MAFKQTNISFSLWHPKVHGGYRKGGYPGAPGRAGGGGFLPRFYGNDVRWRALPALKSGGGGFDLGSPLPIVFFVPTKLWVSASSLKSLGLTPQRQSPSGGGGSVGFDPPQKPRIPRGYWGQPALATLQALLKVLLMGQVPEVARTQGERPAGSHGAEGGPRTEGPSRDPFEGSVGVARPPPPSRTRGGGICVLNACCLFSTRKNPSRVRFLAKHRINILWSEIVRTRNLRAKKGIGDSAAPPLPPPHLFWVKRAGGGVVPTPSSLCFSSGVKKTLTPPHPEHFF